MWLPAAALTLALASFVWGAPVNRKGGPRFPGHMIERLNRMPPEEREHFLEQLTPERRAAVERRLEHYNEMPPEGKERLRGEFDRFQQLPAERQNRVRELFRALNHLSEERRTQVRRAFQQLRSLSPAEREQRLASEPLVSKYDSSERELLGELSGLMNSPPPTTPDP